MAAPRDDKAVERRQSGVEEIDALFDPFDLLLADPQRLNLAVLALGTAQIGAEIEEIVLNTAQYAVNLVIADVENRDTDDRIRLVDPAICGYAHMELWQARTVTERGATIVAGASVDPIEFHGVFRCGRVGLLDPASELCQSLASVSSVVSVERKGVRAIRSLAFGDQIGKAVKNCGGGAGGLVGENSFDGKVEKRIRDKRPLSGRRRRRDFFEQDINQAHHRLQFGDLLHHRANLGVHGAYCRSARPGSAQPMPIGRAAAFLVWCSTLRRSACRASWRSPDLARGA